MRDGVFKEIADDLRQAIFVPVPLRARTKVERDRALGMFEANLIDDVTKEATEIDIFPLTRLTG